MTPWWHDHDRECEVCGEPLYPLERRVCIRCEDEAAALQDKAADQPADEDEACRRALGLALTTPASEKQG
jgi:hypothetical protein